MIFVTVGTHEQPFDRLVKKIDSLKGDGLITEDVLIQIGYGTYEPIHCEYSRFLSYDEMIAKVQSAHIVITHGGPASFLMPLQYGKMPIVVPRQKKFGEHVNDHQAEFCKQVSETFGSIIMVEDVNNILSAINEVKNNPNAKNFASNNQKFCNSISELIGELFRS